jgi:hypothetical protein
MRKRRPDTLRELIKSMKDAIPFLCKKLFFIRTRLENPCFSCNFVGKINSV